MPSNSFPIPFWIPVLGFVEGMGSNGHKTSFLKACTEASRENNGIVYIINLQHR